MLKRLNQFFSIMLMTGFILLTACSFEIDGAIQKDDAFKLEEAIQKGDVVNVHGQIYNYSNFESFFKNIEKKENDKLRIITYTIEGDPIFLFLNYDGSSINLEIDNSKDKYRGNGPTKTNMTCSRIEATENGTKYFLKDCSENSEYLILFVSEIKQ